MCLGSGSGVMPQLELEADGTGEGYEKLEREPRYSDNVEFPKGLGARLQPEIARARKISSPMTSSG